MIELFCQEIEEIARFVLCKRKKRRGISSKFVKWESEKVTVCGDRRLKI